MEPFPRPAIDGRDNIFFPETPMIKSVTTGLCVLALTGTLAFAQSSQGQAGPNTGQTSPTAQKAQTNPMNSNAMAKKKMKKHKKGTAGGMKKDSMSK
jgi:hypothetical protein